MPPPPAECTETNRLLAYTDKPCSVYRCTPALSASPRSIFGVSSEGSRKYADIQPFISQLCSPLLSGSQPVSSRTLEGRYSFLSMTPGAKDQKTVLPEFNTFCLRKVSSGPSSTN